MGTAYRMRIQHALDSFWSWPQPPIGPHLHLSETFKGDSSTVRGMCLLTHMAYGTHGLPPVHAPTHARKKLGKLLQRFVL